MLVLTVISPILIVMSQIETFEINHTGTHSNDPVLPVTSQNSRVVACCGSSELVTVSTSVEKGVRRSVHSTNYFRVGGQ